MALTLTEHGLVVARDRYFLPNENSWTDVARRVARAVASVEKTKAARAEWEEKFFHVINEGYFLPGGRVLRGAGAGYAVNTLYNCFHLPLAPDDLTVGRDSLQSILDTIKRVCFIAAAGGGVGVTISALRPRGSEIRGTGGISLGAVAWLDVFDAAVATLTQSGSRRAALLILLHDWHPDIEEYIGAKLDTTRLQHMNLSVAVSDEFIRAVKEDREWQLVFPDTTHPQYDEVWDGNLQRWRELGYPVRVYKTIKARELWSKICHSAWQSAEPGLVFLDRANALNNVPGEYISGCNACAEQVLPEWGVCNLGSLNLNALSDNYGNIDLHLLTHTIKVAVRLLDNVIDLSPYPYPEIERRQKQTRRIGLGTMGLADLLLKQKLRYGSSESLVFIDQLYRRIANEAYKASAELARERGPAPAYDPAMLERPFLQKLDKETLALVGQNGLRNCVLLSAPPTGTTSIVAGASSGIEPIFAFEYERHDRLGVHKVVHPLYKKWRAEHQDEPLPEWFVTAHDISLEEHIRVQAAIQNWVDASISKTLNAPSTITPEEVERAFLLAYDLGLKTITFYREGSREGVLRKVKNEETAPRPVTQTPQRLPRPALLQGITGRMETPLGRAYITLNRLDDGTPYELFITIGKAGSDVGALTEAIARLASLALRYRVPLAEIVRQLDGIGGRNAVRMGKTLIRSVPDAVAAFLRSLEQAEESPAPDAPAAGSSVLKAELCPECGTAALTRQEGCTLCLNCGYTAC